MLASICAAKRPPDCYYLPAMRYLSLAGGSVLSAGTAAASAVVLSFLTYTLQSRHTAGALKSLPASAHTQKRSTLCNRIHPAPVGRAVLSKY